MSGTHRYGRRVYATEQITIWSIVRCHCYWPPPYRIGCALAIASGLRTGRASRERSFLDNVGILSLIGEHYRSDDLHLADIVVSGDIGEHHISSIVQLYRQVPSLPIEGFLVEIRTALTVIVDACAIPNRSSSGQ